MLLGIPEGRRRPKGLADAGACTIEAGVTARSIWPKTQTDTVGSAVVESAIGSGLSPVRELGTLARLSRPTTAVVFRHNTTGSFLAASAGHGIGLFPNFYRLVASDLTCLPTEGAIRAPLLLSYEKANCSARVHAVVNFLLQRFRQDCRIWFS